MTTDVAGPDGSELSERLGLAPERETDEERYCYQMLAELRRDYEAAAKPYVDRLVRLQCLRPPPTITLTLDQAREFIDIAMSKGA